MKSQYHWTVIIITDKTVQVHPKKPNTAKQNYPGSVALYDALAMKRVHMGVTITHWKHGEEVSSNRFLPKVSSLLFCSGEVTAQIYKL